MKALRLRWRRPRLQGLCLVRVPVRKRRRLRQPAVHAHHEPDITQPRRANSQPAAWVQAWRKTQVPIARICPADSATGMNSAGEMAPSTG